MMEFEITEWTGAGLHKDREALAWLRSFAPDHPDGPYERLVVGPIQLVAEGRVAIHTLPLCEAGAVSPDARLIFAADENGDRRMVGWLSTRRVHSTKRPIPPQVAALFHPPRDVLCPFDDRPRSGLSALS